ncbi:hypothetical protein O0I10_003198 [Lichtheimia ornata]|uniref:Uncharacterized protein n=1 Tax=Lichtheimia ornata TaxID=688661 RepID=A0AAD7V9L2_9FUNG|nr:uncharacterized protein O0I10_003198 [Lichtheimia ornata]KAJ8660976.1 hypothetical protein O0I10_003198 [Lichtheimia ornata]
MTDNNASRKRKHASNDESAHWLFDDTPPPLTILNDLDDSTELLPMPPSSQQHSSLSLFPTSRDTALFSISRRRRQQRDRFNAQDREYMTNAFKQDVTIADRLIVPKIHPLLAPKLKRHQIDGVTFIWKQIVGYMHGCILAHTMGLGKTLQTITFITLLCTEISKKNPVVPRYLMSNRILVLAPLTTISNWMNEFDKWIPQELVQVVGHTYNFADVVSSSTSYAKRAQYLKDWYLGGGVLFMSYEQYRILLTKDSPHQDEMKRYLQDPGPSLLVADEGHRLKSNTSMLALTVSQIRTPARICLTGSPVQNNLDEFYCLVNIVAPSLLPDPQSFVMFYRKPIENIFAESSSTDIYLAKKQLLKLKLLTSDILQRRGPEYLDNDLPAKNEYYIACRMTEDQFTGYVILLDHFRTTGESILISHVALRALCNHPAILRKILVDRNARSGNSSQPTDAGDMDAIVEDELVAFSDLASKMLLECLSNYFDRISDIEDPHHSSKVMAIMEIAKGCKRLGEKLIIVSHSILCLDFLEKLLGSRTYQISRIDGTIPQPQRQDIIDNFNNSPNKDIMLLSARAGSLGVNITGASRIILCDSDWNPVHDEQSIGRIYRYGQVKPVFVYRLFQYSTIEDVLMSRKLHKRGLASRVVDNRYFKRQDMKDIQKYYANPVEKEDVPEECDDPVLNDLIKAEPRALISIHRPRDVENEEIVNEHELSPEDVKKAKEEALGMKKAYISDHFPLVASL